MLFNNNGRVTRYIAGYFLFPLFINEAAKAADIDILPAGHA